MKSLVDEKAENGDVEAQCSLAFLYEIGLDREIDLDKAMFWWRKAAAQGDAVALAKVNQLGDTPPLEDDEPPPTPTNEPIKGQELGTKILLIEDEPDLLSVLAASLEYSGYVVIPESNGEDGLKSLMATPDIKVIVTDLKMPQMNGMQLIKTIRKMKLAEEAIIIVMTAFSKPEFIEMGKKLKVNYWLAKPFDLEKLSSTIDSALTKRGNVA